MTDAPGEAHDALTVAVEDPTSPDALELVQRLSAEIAARYDDEDGSADFTPGDVLVPRSAFLVARLGGRPVGCGALRPLNVPGFEDSAEIKRMYVAPDVRGRRLAAQILSQLEALARDFRYARVVLETGTLQPEAIRLYERSGYQRIPCYGSYADDGYSVCFGKVL